MPDPNTIPHLDPAMFELPPLDFGRLEPFLEDARAFNLDVAGENIDLAFEGGMSRVPGLNELSAGEFTRTLATVAPEAAETQAARDRNILSFLSGEIPEDVATQIAIANAERATATGIGVQSGRARNLVARDVGLTSLDLKERGVDMANVALTGDRALASSLTTDPTSLSLSLLGTYNAAGMVPLTGLLGAGEQEAMAQQAARQTVALSELQRELTLLELAYGKEIADDARRQSLWNSIIGGAATLGAAALMGRRGFAATGSGSGTNPYMSSATLELGGGYSYGNAGVTQNPETGEFEVAPLSLGEPITLRGPSGETWTSQNAATGAYNVPSLQLATGATPGHTPNRYDPFPLSINDPGVTTYVEGIAPASLGERSTVAYANTGPRTEIRAVTGGNFGYDETPIGVSGYGYEYGYTEESP